MTSISETGTLKMPEIKFRKRACRVIGHDDPLQGPCHTWADLKAIVRRVWRPVRGGRLEVEALDDGQRFSIECARMEFDFFPIGSIIDIPERIR